MREVTLWAMVDKQSRYLDGDRSHHTWVAGRDSIPSISESILNPTPRMLTLTYSPSLYYPYKMVVRKLNLSADRNTCISSASVPAVWHKYQKKTVSRRSRLRDCRLPLCAVYRRFLYTVVSLSYHPITIHNTLLKRARATCQETSQWHPTSQLAPKMPAMEPQTRESLLS